MGLCITLSLIAFMLSKKQSITESILDPYLWIYSLAYSTYIITLSYQKYQKRHKRQKIEILSSIYFEALVTRNSKNARKQTIPIVKNASP